MRKYLGVFVLVVLSMFFTGVVFAEEGKPPEDEVQFDVLVNTKTGEISAGGLTFDQVRQLGFWPLSSYAMGFLRFNSTEVISDPEVMTVKINEKKLVAVSWKQRQLLNVFDILDVYLWNVFKYGIPEGLIDQVIDRASLTQAKLSLRTTTEETDVSEEVVVNIAKPVKFDFSDDGVLAIEGAPVYGLHPDVEYVMSEVVKNAKYAGVGNPVVCLNESTITMSADGRDLPSYEVFSEGVDEASSLYKEIPWDLINPVFGFTIGADVAFPGANHSEDESCRK